VPLLDRTGPDAAVLHTGLREERDLQPFLSALGFFVVSFASASASASIPMMVPPTLTIWAAAAPDSKP
jgi:cytochrome d ubiquinol oxidase subunit II